LEDDHAEAFLKNLQQQLKTNAMLNFLYKGMKTNAMLTFFTIKTKLSLQIFQSAPELGLANCQMALLPLMQQSSTAGHIS
jgi:hypothetical protein